MFQRSVLLLSLLGIAIGLLTGIFDSLFHFIDLKEYKLVNIFIFLIFFICLFWSVSFFRNKLLSGFLSYGKALKSLILVGITATLTISIVRFVYLKYIANIDINMILDKTEQTMIDHYSLYKDELINNRLSFIEFSYDPFVSSVLYFIYYLLLVFAFSLIAAFFLRKIDRNISLY